MVVETDAYVLSAEQMYEDRHDVNAETVNKNCEIVVVTVACVLSVEQMYDDRHDVNVETVTKNLVQLP